MRPQKISQPEMLQRCAVVFKQYGYYATSMEMLAKACGLTKAAFYYYYKNKESLLMDVIASVRYYASVKLFPLAYQEKNLEECFEQLHQAAKFFFSQGICGCLMATLALDVKQHLPEAFAQIKAFFAEWQHAMQHLFNQAYPEDLARIYAKQSIADYEGAILMMRISDDEFYLQNVKLRVFTLLQKMSAG